MRRISIEQHGGETLSPSQLSRIVRYVENLIHLTKTGEIKWRCSKFGQSYFYYYEPDKDTKVCLYQGLNLITIEIDLNGKEIGKFKGELIVRLANICDSIYGNNLRELKNKETNDMLDRLDGALTGATDHNTVIRNTDHVIREARDWNPNDGSPSYDKMEPGYNKGGVKDKKKIRAIDLITFPVKPIISIMRSILGKDN